MYIRAEEEIKELEEKVEFIKTVRSIHHSAYKQSLMELLNYSTREVIDFEYKSAIKLLNKLEK